MDCAPERAPVRLATIDQEGYLHGIEHRDPNAAQPHLQDPRRWELQLRADLRGVRLFEARRKKIRRSFSGKGAHAAAKGWRTDAQKQVKDRRLRAPSALTLRQEIDEWLAGARDGSILNKRKQPYKPAVIRNYELSLRLRVLPALGERRLTSIDLGDLLELQEELQGAGTSASVIRNTFVPLQAIFRRARRRGAIALNPAVDLELPTSGRGRRRPLRRSSCSTRWRRASGLCGRRRSMRGCAAASCARFASATSSLRRPWSRASRPDHRDDEAAAPGEAVAVNPDGAYRQALAVPYPRQPD